MTDEKGKLTRIGLIGLGVMGQNLAFNIAEKGFPISVWNRGDDKVVETNKRAKEQKLDHNVRAFHGDTELGNFVRSIAKPRAVILLILAGAPVDQMLAKLKTVMEPGDIVVDGGNEWYQHTERRVKEAEASGLLYLGMGGSGGEEGARHGPSLMPGGSRAAYEHLSPILTKIAAQVDDGPCVTYIGPGGAGNYVKMVHNGIEYGDMQLICEAYDVLKNVGKLSNRELAEAFHTWNHGELKSYLIEITAEIFTVKDPDGEGELIDKVLDKAGSKGTGKWTVQEAAEQAVPCPTMAAALDSRYLSALKDERKAAAGILVGPKDAPVPDKKQLVEDVRYALYASKICSYAQGTNLIRETGKVKGWNLNLGEIARIWKGGCIIRAVFLDRIKSAYGKNAALANLLVDPDFAKEMNERQAALRRVVTLGIMSGVSMPAFANSLAYLDSYRRERLPANLIQAQRDYFGAHTYQRVDKKGPEPFHTEWHKLAQPFKKA